MKILCQILGESEQNQCTGACTGLGCFISTGSTCSTADHCITTLQMWLRGTAFQPVQTQGWFYIATEVSTKRGNHRETSLSLS